MASESEKLRKRVCVQVLGFKEEGEVSMALREEMWKIQEEGRRPQGERGSIRY